MTVEQRIELCRAYAREAEMLAEAARSPEKERYQRIAALWLVLAAELECAASGSAAPYPDTGKRH